MENINIEELIKELNLNTKIELDDIPEIDLYMDQVMQLFESKLLDAKRNEDDKVLTKTMINNYAKGKLLMSINNKKYSKEHLILMSLIYNLKGPLSISDVKSSLNYIVDSFENGREYPLRELYNCYLKEYDKDYQDFKSSVEKRVEIVEELSKSNDEISSGHEEKFLLLCSLVNMSNMYRRLSEKLIDEYFNK